MEVESKITIHNPGNRIWLQNLHFRGRNTNASLFPAISSLRKQNWELKLAGKKESFPKYQAASSPISMLIAPQLFPNDDLPSWIIGVDDEEWNMIKYYGGS